MAVINKKSKNIDKYFLKYAPIEQYAMLYAEYEGVLSIYDTNTINVPKPIAYGKVEKTDHSFVLFEYLNFWNDKDNDDDDDTLIDERSLQFELGIQLAKVRVLRERDSFLFLRKATNIIR